MNFRKLAASKGERKTKLKLFFLRRIIFWEKKIVVLIYLDFNFSLPLEELPLKQVGIALT